MIVAGTISKLTCASARYMRVVPCHTARSIGVRLRRTFHAVTCVPLYVAAMISLRQRESQFCAEDMLRA